MKKRYFFWLLSLVVILAGISCVTLYAPWDVSDGPFTVQQIIEEERR